MAVSEDLEPASLPAFLAPHGSQSQLASPHPCCCCCSVLFLHTTSADLRREGGRGGAGDLSRVFDGESTKPVARVSPRAPPAAEGLGKLLARSCMCYFPWGGLGRGSFLATVWPCMTGLTCTHGVGWGRNERFCTPVFLCLGQMPHSHHRGYCAGQAILAKRHRQPQSSRAACLAGGGSLLPSLAQANCLFTQE